MSREKVQPIIFPNIPRFPEEPPISDMPNAEVSVFNRRRLTGVLDGISSFMSPNANSKKRNEIIRQLCESYNLPEINEALSMLIDSANFERGTKYTELEAKIAQKLLPKEANTKVPNAALDLTNNCLQQAYPNYFGNFIPHLEAKDLRVVADGDYDDFAVRTTKNEIHSYHRSGNLQFDIGDSNTDFLTIPYLSNGPILIRESFMRDLEDLPADLKSVVISSLLIHENIHRGSIEHRKILKPEDYGLARMAFTDYLNLPATNDIEVESGQEGKDFLSSMLDNEKHKPHLKIHGTVCNLYIYDPEINDYKAFSQSGYDLNEAITETIADKARNYLTAFVHVKDNLLIELLLKSALKKNTMSVAYQEKSTREINELLASIGLDSEEAIFNAYFNNQIPILLSQKK